jgi:hypothetical protein
MLLVQMNLTRSMLVNGQTTCFTGSGSASPKMVRNPNQAVLSGFFQFSLCHI